MSLAWRGLLLRAAGCMGIGVTWGAHEASQLREAGASAVVDSMASLRALLMGG